MTVQTIIQHSLRIAKKDLTELFRNRLGLVLLIVMPLFMMVMVGFIYPSNGTVTNLQIGVVNDDAGFNGVFVSNMSTGGFLPTLQAINSQTHMLIMTNVSSTADLKDQVQRGAIEGGIVIPSNFSPDIRHHKRSVNWRVQCNGSTSSNPKCCTVECNKLSCSG